MTVSRQVEECLSVLSNLPLWGTTRAADLQSFQFGAKRKINGRKGRRMVGVFALHIQCAWRIRGSRGIVVASRDRYYPTGNVNRRVESFDWDVVGGNRLDERIQNFFRGYCPLIVQSVAADASGSFTLALERRYVLEVFPDDSLSTEHWRLLEPATDRRHRVFSGRRMLL